MAQSTINPRRGLYILNSTKYIVITDYAVVKKTQNLFSQSLGVLKKGDLVEVISINFLMAKITYNNQIGYVFSVSLQKYEPILGSITISYLNSTTGQTVIASETHPNLFLGDYAYEAKPIEDYTLISTSPVTVTLTQDRPHQVITFEYKQILGSVSVNYINPINQEMILPTEIKDNLTLGDYSFEAPVLKGYNIISASSVSIRLTKDAPNQSITFEYSEILGSIEIRYLNQEDQIEISSSDFYQQLTLGSYTYEAKNMDGYSLITDTLLTVELTVHQPHQTLIFEYKKEEEPEFIPLDESLQNEVPYISTYYIKPIVAPGEEVTLDYYITDYYHKEYTDDDYSNTFIVTLHIEDRPDIILRNLKAGDHSVNLGHFTLEREQKFSILCTDQYGRNSHELFNFFLVHTEPEVKEYMMTEKDLITYNIKNTDDYEELLEVPLTLGTVNATTVKGALTEFASTYTPKSNTYTCFLPKTSDTDDPARWWASIVTKYADDYSKEAVTKQSQSTRTGLQQLLDDKAAQGYNKLKLLPGVYRIDHTGTLYIPTKFTLDLNQATIKLNQFTGNSALMITLNNTFNSHVINGTIDGDFYSHDYASSTNNSEWVNGISIGGEAKYSSFEDLTIKNITGYGSTNGITNSRNASLGYTYLYPQGIGNNFKIGDIDRTTGLDITSPNRTTSNFRDITGYAELGYLSISVYLGYQGNPCGTWNLITHFYDENKNYITSTDTYQYRRIGVPKDAKYLRVTILNESYPSTLSIQLFRIPTHCSFQNCNHENCRCVGMAPAAMKDMLVENCEFTRCGRSGANCAFDAEDGWDMMQDVTFKHLNFYNNPANEFLTCAGHNLIIDAQIAGSHYIYKRTHEYVIKNCNISKASYESGDITTLGIPRILKNDFSNICKANGITINNCTGRLINGNVINSNIIYIGTGNFKNCTFTYDDVDIPYLSTCNLSNCIIQTKSSDITSNLRFNSENGPFTFSHCIFHNKTHLNSNNNFSNAIFKNCSFDDVHMNVMVTSNNNNNILFEDCNFTINSSDYFIYISPFAYSTGISNLTFNNCIVKVTTSYTGFKLIYAYSKPNNSLYEFNNCTLKQDIGTIFEWVNFYTENFENFCIKFTNCNKISVLYTTKISNAIFNSSVIISEISPHSSN